MKVFSYLPPPTPNGYSQSDGSSPGCNRQSVFYQQLLKLNSSYFLSKEEKQNQRKGAIRGLSSLWQLLWEVQQPRFPAEQDPVSETKQKQLMKPKHCRARLASALT